MEIYLMHVNTGSVDTVENWKSEYLAMAEHKWHGFGTVEEFKKVSTEDNQLYWDDGLVSVVKNNDGEWE